MSGDIIKGSATKARVVSTYADAAGLNGKTFMAGMVGIADLGLKSNTLFDHHIPPLQYRRHQAAVSRWGAGG
jgi:hypothetical protein